MMYTRYLVLFWAAICLKQSVSHGAFLHELMNTTRQGMRCVSTKAREVTMHLDADTVLRTQKALNLILKERGKPGRLPQPIPKTDERGRFKNRPSLYQTLIDQFKKP